MPKNKYLKVFQAILIASLQDNVGIKLSDYIYTYNNMKQRFYFDTSVFGGMFDAEFEEETTLLFERVNLGQVICVYSSLTENELSKAPQKIRDFFFDIEIDHKEFISVTPEALELAKTYIAEKVVGQTSLDDCIHIAVATLSKVDILVSWTSSIL